MRSDSASETTPIISPISSFSTSPSSSLGTNSTSSAPLITQPALNSSHRMPIRQEDEQEELTEFRIFVDGGDGEEEDEDGSKVIEFREPLQALRPTIGSNQQEHNGFDFADSFLYMEMRKLKRATSGSYQQGRYTNPPPLSLLTSSSSPSPLLTSHPSPHITHLLLSSVPCFILLLTRMLLTHYHHSVPVLVSGL